MSNDLYKLQNKLEAPRRQKKPKKKSAGFSAQKKALEATGYMVKSKK